jgi:molybdate transport system regulatory protein
MEHSKPRPAFKVWMKTDDGYVFGPGVYSLLKKVEETGTLKEGASSLGMSYRYAWGLVRKAEERLREPLLFAHKGGRSGGGGAELTDRGKQFIADFELLRLQMQRVSETPLQDFVFGKVREVKSLPNEVELLVRVEVKDEINIRKGDYVLIQKTSSD